MTVAVKKETYEIIKNVSSAYGIPISEALTLVTDFYMLRMGAEVKKSLELRMQWVDTILEQSSENKSNE